MKVVENHLKIQLNTDKSDLYDCGYNDMKQKMGMFTYMREDYKKERSIRKGKYVVSTKEKRTRQLFNFDLTEPIKDLISHIASEVKAGLHLPSGK